MRVIMVPVADRPECARALATAFELGKHLGASVSGCHMRPHRYSDVSLSPAFAESAWRRKSTSKAPAAAKTLYQQIAERSGYEVIRRARATPGALWSEKVGSPAKLMGILGPVSDLIIVSRPKKPRGIADMFLDAALTESGRPVLILPQTGRRNVGRRICIGWDQSTRAAQTVASVMPLLQQASEVTIISCGTEDRPGPKASQLSAYMAHWGVKSKRVSTRGRNVEDELLVACKEAKADMLIAGAYSRSRWREQVFGGTTEFLVHRARLPVLMMHSG